MAEALRFPIHPKLGVLFFSSGWFREVGLQEPGSDCLLYTSPSPRDS